MHFIHHFWVAWLHQYILSIFFFKLFVILSPHLHLLVDEFPVFIALQKSLVVTLFMRIATIFFIIIVIMIFPNDLEYIGGSSVLPSNGGVNVSRQTSPVCRDPVGTLLYISLSKGFPLSFTSNMVTKVHLVFPICSPFRIAGHHSWVIQLPILREDQNKEHIEKGGTECFATSSPRKT